MKIPEKSIPACGSSRGTSAELSYRIKELAAGKAAMDRPE